MRFKAVPPTPPSEVVDGDDVSDGGSDGDGGSDEEHHADDVVEALAAVRDALPLVPRSEDDCCARLVERVGWIDDRDVATEWILFLRALGLAEHSDAGYARVRDEIDREAVAERFREQILGAREVLSTIDAETDPTTAETAFEAVEAVVPEWERRRSDAWREEWRTHTERLLVWATLLGLTEERTDGYVRA